MRRRLTRVDGNEVVRPSDRPSEVGLLADGTLFYVLETSNRGGPSKRRLVVGGHEDPPFDSLREVRLSPDGSGLAYVGSGPRETVMVRGRKLGESHLAWAGKVGGHSRAFVDGVPGPAHDWVEDVSFDPTGKQVAYAARDQPRGPWYIVAGKASGPAYDWVGPLWWSSDGRRVAYAARLGREVWWKVLLVP
jgi:hypothetical protein